MLNKIWVSFFFISFIASLVQFFFFHQYDIFQQIISAIFSMAKVTVEIAIGLIGVMCFWLGMMKIAENSGFIRILSKFISPLFSKLMPEVPKNHPAMGSMTMNLSANFLGLDNAATPLGLKAMSDLQSLNKNPDTATNAQILFLVLNTSSITLFPITVFMYRAQQGAAVASDVFLPILFATSASTFAGLLAVAWVQRINLLQKTVVLYFASILALLFALIIYFIQLSSDALAQQSAIIGNFLIFLLLIVFIGFAFVKKVNVYDSFIEGAKGGFDICIKIIPFLLAMLCAIGVLRASGVLDLFVGAIGNLVGFFGGDTRFVDALPTALIKPLSGSGARAMMIETMNTYGADSFAGRLASIMQGSTETTFYVLALYFGSVGIKYTRHAITCGLIADIAGMLAAITVCYWFFG